MHPSISTINPAQRSTAMKTNYSNAKRTQRWIPAFLSTVITVILVSVVTFGMTGESAAGLADHVRADAMTARSFG
jgi:hypothetical protein